MFRPRSAGTRDFGLLIFVRSARSTGTTDLQSTGFYLCLLTIVVQHEQSDR